MFIANFDLINNIHFLVPNPITKSPIRIRIGIHSGAVVAGVVGVKVIYLLYIVF